MLAFFFVPHGYHIFLVEKDYTAKMKMIGAWSFCAMAILKYAIVLARRDGIKRCIDRIAMDWKNVDKSYHREIMLRNAKTCRVFTKLCVVFMFSGSMFHSTLLPVVTTTKSSGTSGIHNLSANKVLPFPSEFIMFDAKISPMYEIVFVGHTVSVAVLCTVASGVCTLAVKFVMHAYSQYQIVISLLECLEVDENLDSNNTEKQMNDILRRHLHVLTFVPKIETVLNEICLVELVGCTLNICFVGYHLIMKWEDSEPLGIITYIVLLTSFVSNIFIFCYIGELLTEQSKKVGLACYMIDWWYLPRGQARAVVMFIAASDFPIKFTAGKIINLSLQSFCSVIKASVTYLNVLRNSMV
nr:olfactory receptor 73 [Gregopimpla kuwanae]